MVTKFYRVNIKEDTPMSDGDAAVVEAAGRILREGGLVAIPTETVYGLGGDALDARCLLEDLCRKGTPVG